MGIGGICPRCWAKIYRAQIKERGEWMGEYSNIIETKELKTLEIDIDKNIFKVNGDELKRCLRLHIEIDANKREVCLLSDTTVRFQSFNK